MLVFSAKGKHKLVKKSQPSAATFAFHPRDGCQQNGQEFNEFQRLWFEN